jgi:hypothetical protein
MGDALGVVGMLVFIVCVIALAAAVTYLVVKISPARNAAEQTPPQR